MLFFLANPKRLLALVQTSKYLSADDVVTGSVQFKNGVLLMVCGVFQLPNHHTDLCEIVGTKGSIQFSVFGGNRFF